LGQALPFRSGAPLSLCSQARAELSVQAVIEVCVDFTLAAVIGARLHRLMTGFSGTDRLISRMLR
jgi:hypothetical protein